MIDISIARGCLACSGELTLVSSRAFIAAAERALVSRPPLLKIDVSGVSFIDSTGIHALFRVQQLCKEAGSMWQLSTNANIDRLLRLLQVEQQLLFGSAA